MREDRPSEREGRGREPTVYLAMLEIDQASSFFFCLLSLRFLPLWGIDPLQASDSNNVDQALPRMREIDRLRVTLSNSLGSLPCMRGNRPKFKWFRVNRDQFTSHMRGNRPKLRPLDK